MIGLKENGDYKGIKDISIEVNERQVYRGQLPRLTNEGQKSLDGQLSFVEIDVPSSCQGSRFTEKVLMKTESLKAESPGVIKSFCKTQNYRDSGPCLSGTEILSDNNSASNQESSSQKSSVRREEKGSHIKIIEQSILSDDERPSIPDSEGHRNTVNDYSHAHQSKKSSVDLSKDGRQEHDLYRNLDRSTSKCSKASNESKRKNHPKMANSSAKLIFENNPITFSQVKKPMLHSSNSAQLSTVEEIARAKNFDTEKSYKLNTRTREASNEVLKPYKASRNLIPVLERNSLKTVGPDRGTQFFQKLLEENKHFELPNLPLGRTVNIKLFTNWGDSQHIGLNNIEFFDLDGKKIAFNQPEKNIWQETEEENKMFGPSIHNDSEFLKKLISEKIYVKDGGNLWMTTFKSGSPLEIGILLPKKTRISMIRIWNYNKSRIHSTRGVRHISIEMDKKIIFLGEVQKFSGDNCNYLEEAEYILFTENKAIVNNIDSNDWLNVAMEESVAERGHSVDRGSVRPGTGHGGLHVTEEGRPRGDDLSQTSCKS
jgi:hypothetical protein